MLLAEFEMQFAVGLNLGFVRSCLQLCESASLFASATPQKAAQSKIVKARFLEGVLNISLIILKILMSRDASHIS